MSKRIVRAVFIRLFKKEIASIENEMLEAQLRFDKSDDVQDLGLAHGYRYALEMLQLRVSP